MSGSGSGGRAGGGGSAAAAPGVRFPSDSDAARAAREEVNAMFRSADQLGRLPVFLSECIRKKGAIEAQLSSAVRTQVDETRLGLQLLNDAAAMMTRMRHNFHAIDAYCKDCKSVLRDTPEIQRVNTARKNLDATTRLLDKFRSLPAQAEALLEELDEKDRAIKNVYKRMRLLFRLRDSAMDQPSGGTLPGPGGAGGFSADFLSQLKENFEELTRSADEVEARVWENMSDAVFLAKDDPVTLVRTLEVIEMEDRAMRKVFGAARKDAPVAGGGDKVRGVGHASVVLSGDRASQLSMREKALNVLEKSIADLFNHLHIDEEQSAEQERKMEKEKKAKQAKIDEARAKAKKEEEQRRREAAARARREDGDDDEDGGSDVDEPEDLPSPAFDKLGRSKGLFPSDDDEADDDADGAQGGKDGSGNGPSDYILSILEEMTDLVENLPTILSTTAPCFPPEYELPRFYIERYCRWMKLTLSFHCNEPGKLSKKAQLKAVNWLEWYRGELRKWERSYPGTTPLRTTAARALLEAGDDQPGPGAPGKKARVDAAKKEALEAAFLDDLVRELMRAYTASTTETLLKLCDNILRAEETAEAELDGEGRYITSGPADLFYTINSTIEIVLQSFGLNAQPLSHVCLMVADVFNTYQNAQLRFLREVEMDDDVLYFGPERIRKDDTFFCAVINNCSACQNHMDDLKDKILDRLREAEGIAEATPLATQSSSVAAHNSSSLHAPKTLLEQMEDLFEECNEGFVSVASEAIDLLVLQITVTLQKPTGNLFTPSWLKDSSVTDDIILTLQDFADDYKKWIGRDAYFSRMLIKTMHSVVAEYLRKLTEVKPQVSTQLFERLKADKQILHAFFMQFSNEDPMEPQIVPAAVIKNELRLLTLVNKVVHEDPDFMSVHFDKIIGRFGHSAKEVMEGLMSMRTDLSKSQRKEVMDKFVQKLPAADPAALLQQQLVSQSVAAMSSPRARKGDDDATQTKSFWDVFKSREKKPDKPKPSAALLAAKRMDEDGQSMTDFLS